MEYISEKMTKALRSLDIESFVTPSYSPESNGIAELLNRTLAEGTISILQELIKSQKSQNFEVLWAEAIATMNVIRNKSLTKATHPKNGDKTPFEIIFRRKPDLSNLRIFSSPVFVKKPKIHMKEKFIIRTWEGFHVGHALSNAYRVYVPDLEKIMISNDMLFNEKIFLRDNIQSTEMKPNNVKERPNGDHDCLEYDVSILSEATPSVLDENDGIGREVKNTENMPKHIDTSALEHVPVTSERRRSRPRRPLQRLAMSSILAILTVEGLHTHVDDYVPINLTEAVECAGSSK